MNCSEVRELLSPMTDRELSAENLKLIEEHLQTCKDCAFQSTMMVGMKNLLQRWDGVHPSQVFRSKIMDRIRKDPPPGLFSRLSPSLIVSVVAGLAAVGIAVVFVVTRGPSTDGEKTHVPTGGEIVVDVPEDSDGQGLIVPQGGSDAPAVQVFGTEGAVRLEQADGVTSLGSAGDVLARGHAIGVSDKGRADLVAVNGLEMRLENGGRLAFGGDDTDCELSHGRLLVRAGQRDADRAVYRVSCGGAIVEIAEGDILLSSERLSDGSVHVAVETGSATIVAASGTHALSAGQMSEVAEDGSVRYSQAEAEAAEVEHLRRWRKKQ